MLTTLPVPPELAAAMGPLTGARQTAVLAARAAWIDGGLLPAAADKQAVAYAKRIYGKRQQLVMKTRKVDRAAAGTEKAFVDTFNHAIKVAVKHFDEEAIIRALKFDTQVPEQLTAVVQALKVALG